MGLAEFDQSEQSTTTEPCRFDGGCWRPLCPFRHSGADRAARWAAEWALLAAHERIDEQIVHMPVPQIAAKIPEVVETITKEHISDDLPVQQVVKENLEVIKGPAGARGCASVARGDRRIGEVGLTRTSARAERRGDNRGGEPVFHADC